MFLLRKCIKQDDLAKTNSRPAKESPRLVLPNLFRALSLGPLSQSNFVACNSGLVTTVCWPLRLNVRMRAQGFSGNPSFPGTCQF